MKTLDQDTISNIIHAKDIEALAAVIEMDHLSLDNIIKILDIRDITLTTQLFEHLFYLTDGETIPLVELVYSSIGKEKEDVLAKKLAFVLSLMEDPYMEDASDFNVLYWIPSIYGNRDQYNVAIWWIFKYSPKFLQYGLLQAYCRSKLFASSSQTRELIKSAVEYIQNYLNPSVWGDNIRKKRLFKAICQDNQFTVQFIIDTFFAHRNKLWHSLGMEALLNCRNTASIRESLVTEDELGCFAISPIEYERFLALYSIEKKPQKDYVFYLSDFLHDESMYIRRKAILVACNVYPYRGLIKFSEIYKSIISSKLWESLDEELEKAVLYPYDCNLCSISYFNQALASSIATNDIAPKKRKALQEFVYNFLLVYEYFGKVTDEMVLDFVFAAKNAGLDDMAFFSEALRERNLRCKKLISDDLPKIAFRRLAGDMILAINVPDDIDAIGIPGYFLEPSSSWVKLTTIHDIIGDFYGAGPVAFFKTSVGNTLYIKVDDNVLLPVDNRFYFTLDQALHSPFG